MNKKRAHERLIVGGIVNGSECKQRIEENHITIINYM